MPENGFLGVPPDSGMVLRDTTPVSIPWVRLAPQAHHAELSSETSTTEVSPVRSRWNSAAHDPAGDRHGSDGVAERRHPGGPTSPFLSSVGVAPMGDARCPEPE